MKSSTHLFFENLLLSTLTFFKILIRSNFRVKFPPKDQFKNDILIIGNGPSLNQSIEKLLALGKEKMDFLAVNFFAFSEYFERFSPNLYVIAAPEFWLEDVDQDYKDKRLELFRKMVELVDWDFYLFVPFEGKKIKFWQEILKKNSHIKLSFFNTTPVEGFYSLNKIFYKYKLGQCRPHNIIIPSLFIALGLNYRNIYLIGVEHSWLPNILVNEKNEVLIKQDHFYDNKEAVYKPMKKLGKGKRHLHEVLEKFYLTFKGYFEIDKYARSNNARIYNLTINSYIDAFEKIDIDKIYLNK
ncbi:MAG: hypothetical protein KFF73_16475 [Cyclobacteriaceae bacterium]|nr:hypothetical protein [Cyclobacteriaceae bacterium]